MMLFGWIDAVTNLPRTISDAISTETLIALFTVALVVAWYGAWKVSTRSPLHYDIFLVSVRTGAASRFLQLLHLGRDDQRLSGEDLLRRVREPSTRAPPNSRPSAETYVVIHSPNTAHQPPNTPTSSLLSERYRRFEIEISHERAGAQRDSQLATAVALGIIGGRVYDPDDQQQQLLPAVVDSAVSPGQPASTSALQPEQQVPAEANPDAMASTSVEPWASEEEDGTDEIATENPITTTWPDPLPAETTANYFRRIGLSICGAVPSLDAELQEKLQNSQRWLSAYVSSSGFNSKPTRVLLMKMLLNLARDVIKFELETAEKMRGPTNLEMRVKFLDDREQLCHAWTAETIAEFKLRQFPDDVLARRVVRLIFRGQLFRDDSRTLGDYGLSADEVPVLHCHISTAPYRAVRADGSLTNAPPPPSSHSQQQPAQDPQLRQRTAAAFEDDNRRNDERAVRTVRHRLFDAVFRFFFFMRRTPIDTFHRWMISADRAEEIANGTPAREIETARRIVRTPYVRILSYFGEDVYANEEGNDGEGLDAAAEAAARVGPRMINVGDHFELIVGAGIVALWAFALYVRQYMQLVAWFLLILFSLSTRGLLVAHRAAGQQQERGNGGGGGRDER